MPRTLNWTNGTDNDGDRDWTTLTNWYDVALEGPPTGPPAMGDTVQFLDGDVALPTANLPNAGEVFDLVIDGAQEGSRWDCKFTDFCGPGNWSYSSLLVGAAGRNDEFLQIDKDSAVGGTATIYGDVYNDPADPDLANLIVTVKSGGYFTGNKDGWTITNLITIEAGGWFQPYGNIIANGGINLAGKIEFGGGRTSVLDVSSPINCTGDCIISWECDWVVHKIYGGLNANGHAVTHENLLGYGSELVCDQAGTLDLGTTDENDLAVTVSAATTIGNDFACGSFSVGANVNMNGKTITCDTLTRDGGAISGTGALVLANPIVGTSGTWSFAGHLTVGGKPTLPPNCDQIEAARVWPPSAIGVTLVRPFSTRNAVTGVLTDADALPTGLLYVNDAPSALAVTVANTGTGQYTATVTLAGLANGDRCELHIIATVAGVTMGLARQFVIDATVASVAAAVWAVGTRTLTTFGSLVADTATAVATAVWAAAARTLTAFGFTVAGAKDGVIDTIAGQTDVKTSTRATPGDVPTPAANAAKAEEVMAAAHGAGSWEGIAESDWTAAERKQIRDALGVAGDKTTASGGQLQAVKAKTDLITAGAVRVRTPVAADGTITLMRGDSYQEAEGMALSLDIPNYAGPDLVAEGIILVFSVGPRREGRPPIFTVEASAKMNGTTLVLSADVGSEETVLLDAPGEYLYDFQAVFASGGIFTPVAGKLLAMADVTAEPETE